MVLGIVEAFNVIKPNVKEAIRMELKERNPKGILKDVESFETTSEIEHSVDFPLVWLVENDTVPDRGNGSIDSKEAVITPFEFVCVVLDEEDDFEISEEKATNLAARVGASLLTNWNKVKINLPEKESRPFIDIRFKKFSPVGEMIIEGKSKKVPATSIQFDFVTRIHWKKCKDKEEKAP